MKLARHSSKRVPLARKYNLQTKVKAHNQKLKKHANKIKKNGVLAHRKRATAASISIPNAWPHKRELLAELQAKKDASVLEKLAAKNRKKAGIPEPIATLDRVVPTYEELAARSTERAQQFDATRVQEQSFLTDSSASAEIAQTRKRFYDDLVKVIDSADVVLVVLDARDPESCRSEKIETDIRANGKRLVFILNKIDLVPSESVQAWLATLRKIAPTIPFKASTTMAGKTSAKMSTNEDSLKSSSGSFGADKLVQLVKQYSRQGDLGTGSLSVGVVGFPNVGKSSIINTLMGLRKGASNYVKTGNLAGVTRGIQEVNLDNKITLIDCAGVVFPSNSASNDASLVLRRAINVDSLRDPIGTVGRLIQHRGVNTEGLCQLLRIPLFNDATELIRNVAAVHGKMKRGGGADLEASARYLLNKVSDSKSNFYTMPTQSEGPAGGFATIVNEFKPEFDIEQ